MKNHYLGIILLFLLSCANETETKNEKKNIIPADTVQQADTALLNHKASEAISVSCTNDSLNELACLMAGILKVDAKIYSGVFSHKIFMDYAARFDQKWKEYDTTRLVKLKKFQREHLAPATGLFSTLFYPFSGPDFLYANSFFPDAETYILMGLEPVGTLPNFSREQQISDSSLIYFSNIKPALHAILNFSFFRTASMKTDLRNQQLDGTLHLLLLFLKRTGHEICSVQAGVIDSSGTWKKISGFAELQKKISNNKGVEICFTNKDGKKKILYYFSLHLEDGALKTNKNIRNYFSKMNECITYLKGASYLMHEHYFSAIRNYIFNKSSVIVQDDSGIALRYFSDSGFNWDFSLFGKYTKPISLFGYAYQPEMDSLWKVKGSTDIGFGIGYNFKDKNSNLMIAKKIR